MIEFLAKLKGLMASLSAAEVTAAGTCEYSKVEEDLEKLSVAVGAAKAADEADASSYWTDIKSRVVNLFHYDSEKSRFESEADGLKEQADALLRRVEARCWAQIGIHRNVPRDLREDQQAWTDNRTDVVEKIRKIKTFPQMANWSGYARGNYDTIVVVQIKALTELEGIMSSTAQSCSAGAQLNCAVFFVVAKAIRKATGAIEGAEGSGFLTYYRRTSRAIQVLQDLLSEIGQAESGGVADGSANALSREHRNTIQMPNLLRVGVWPTGSEGAAYSPARTDKGVQGDGSDADLRVDGNTGSEGEGVKL